MAEEMEQTNETPEDQEDTRVKEYFEKFVDDLEKDEIAGKATECKGAEEAEEDAEEALTQKREAWQKAMETLEEYQSIQAVIAVKIHQNAKDLHTKFGKSKDVFDGFKSQLGDAVKCVKNLHKKILLVQEAVNQLDNTIKDSCNQQDFKHLDDKVSLQDKVNQLDDLTKVACQQSADGFDSAVKIAGLRALLNLESLKGAGEDIEEDVVKFKEDVAQNITDATKKVTDTAAERVSATEERCTASIDVLFCHQEMEALKLLKQFAHPEKNRKKGMTVNGLRVPDNIDELVHQAEKNFTDPIVTDD